MIIAIINNLKIQNKNNSKNKEKKTLTHACTVYAERTKSMRKSQNEIKIVDGCGVGEDVGQRTKSVCMCVRSEILNWQSSSDKQILAFLFFSRRIFIVSIGLGCPNAREIF